MLYIYEYLHFTQNIKCLARLHMTTWKLWNYIYNPRLHDFQNCLVWMCILAMHTFSVMLCTLFRTWSRWHRCWPRAEIAWQGARTMGAHCGERSKKYICTFHKAKIFQIFSMNYLIVHVHMYKQWYLMQVEFILELSHGIKCSCHTPIFLKNWWKVFCSVPVI